MKRWGVKLVFENDENTPKIRIFVKNRAWTIEGEKVEIIYKHYQELVKEYPYEISYDLYLFTLKLFIEAMVDIADFLENNLYYNALIVLNPQIDIDNWENPKLKIETDCCYIILSEEETKQIFKDVDKLIEMFPYDDDMDDFVLLAIAMCLKERIRLLNEKE